MNEFKARILIDFDNTIHGYQSGWKGEDVIPDPPNNSSLYKIQEYYDAGFEVVIFSTRAASERGADAIAIWFDKHGLREDVLHNLVITDKKLPAKITIDDRAFRYRGIFPSVHFINNFKPWNAEDINEVFNVATKLYNAYCRSTGGVSAVTGDKLPLFGDCPTAVKQAWIDVSVEVCNGNI